MRNRDGSCNSGGKTKRVLTAESVLSQVVAGEDLVGWYLGKEHPETNQEAARGWSRVRVMGLGAGEGLRLECDVRSDRALGAAEKV